MFTIHHLISASRLTLCIAMPVLSRCWRKADLYNCSQTAAVAYKLFVRMNYNIVGILAAVLLAAFLALQVTKYYT